MYLMMQTKRYSSHRREIPESQPLIAKHLPILFRLRSFKSCLTNLSPKNKIIFRYMYYILKKALYLQCGRQAGKMKVYCLCWKWYYTI